MAPRLLVQRPTEAALGATIAAVWAALATLRIVPLVVVAVCVVATLALHAAAVETGSHAFLWASTGWVIGLIALSARSVLAGAEPLVFTIAGISALAYNELVRIGFARRRNAAVDQDLYVASAAGVGLVSLVAVIGIGLAQPLASGEGRSWLWMLVAAAVVALIGVAFTVIPAWRAPAGTKTRWHPGERLPPPDYDHGENRPTTDRAPS